MKPSLIIISWFALATAMIGAPTPESVQQNLEACTTASFFEPTWGLVCPESSAPIAEIKEVTAEKHERLTILPTQAYFADGALVFNLRNSAAVVGAWNCENRLPQDRRPCFGERFDIEVEFEQSPACKTVWTVIPWYDGSRMDLGQVVAQREQSARTRKEDAAKYVESAVYRYCRRQVEGAGRHTIKIEDTGGFFKRVKNTAPFDGFELEIRGPAGTEIKVHRITVSQKARLGGFRREFDLPEGPIWRAVGNVNRKTLVYVNGVEVPNSSPLFVRPHPHWSYGQQFQEVDLKPYLKPGKNVIAAAPAFTGDANSLLKASIVMTSGEQINVNTDPTWRYVPACGKGWTDAGFTGETRAITNEMPFSASELPKNLTAIRYGYRLYMQDTHRQPAYDGRLLLQSPEDDQLYFSAEKPFQMRVLCPAGLAAAKPAVDWLLCRYPKGGKLESVLSGTAADFKVQGDSLECTLDGGGQKLSPGVYVIKAVLRDATGKVLEDRIPEPCIVTARIPMETTPGKTFDDGLRLEEEAVIDFTKPDDPQFPWMEIDGKEVCAKPIIVTRNGLTYRETRTGGSDYNNQILITYNYEFKNPGDFYLLKLVYPDDQPRFFGVCLCSEHDGKGDHSKAGPSVWTGIWHLNSGRMQELTWLFRPDPGFTSINMINMLPGAAAAASKLTISRVLGRLPELKTGGSVRHFGILTESARSYSGFGKTFRSSDNPQTADKIIYGLAGAWENNAKSNSVLKVRLDAFVEWFDTCNRYTEYLRWAGQNVIFLAFFQYNGDGPNAEPLSVTGDSRLVPHITDIAARVFRDNGIDFFSSVEYASDPILHAKYKDLAGVDNSPYLMSGEGRESRVWVTSYNFNHPEVRQSMLRVASEAVRKFQKLPNFRGVNFTTSFSSCMMGPNYFTADDGVRPLDPLRYDYSDATVSLFQKDTGVQLAVDPQSPGRFKTRHQLLTTDPLREKWIEWRAQNMVKFFLEMRDNLRRIKPDVKVTTGVISSSYFFDYMVDSGQTAEQSMRAFGWDFDKFHGQEGIYTLPWLQGSARYGFINRNTGQNERYESYLRHLKANLTPAHLKIGDGATERMAMIDYCWLELERGAQALLPQRPHWQVPYQYTMEGNAQGDAALEPYLLAMAAIDPDSVLYGFTDTNLKIGNEQPMREFAQFLRSLPKAKFQPLAGPDTELIMRNLQQDNKLLFYALNPAPWPVKATIKIASATKITSLISGETYTAPVEIVIPPYHGMSFASDGQASVQGWKTAATGDMFPKYLKHMEEQIRVTAEWLADRKVASVLLPEQLQVMHNLLKDIKAALDAGQPAKAWQLCNSWDFIWYSYFLERQSDAVQYITEEEPAAVDMAKRTIAAPRTDSPPMIDGKLDDPAWQKISPQGGFIDKDGKASVIGTTVRLAWDDKNLYLAFTCREKFPDRLKRDAQTEGEVMRDDCLVFLLQPNLQNSRHFQLAFNPAGVKFDQQDYDYAFAPDWKVAVQVTADGWTAEVAFPFAALEAKPEAGTKWGANFCRIFRLNRLPWSTWSYMPKNWHDPAGYGVVEFK